MRYICSNNYTSHAIRPGHRSMPIHPIFIIYIVNMSQCMNVHVAYLKPPHEPQSCIEFDYLVQARVQEFVRGGGPKSESLFFCFSIYQGRGPSSENR